MNDATRNEVLRTAIRNDELSLLDAQTAELGLTGRVLFDAQEEIVRIESRLNGRRAALAAK